MIYQVFYLWSSALQKQQPPPFLSLAKKVLEELGYKEGQEKSKGNQNPAIICKKIFLKMRVFLRFFFVCVPFFKSLLNLLQCWFWFFVLVFGPWGMWDLWPGIEPTPPALEGKVLTPGPPRKSLSHLYKVVTTAIYKIQH